MTAHLAILLPGRDYGALGPALRLPRLAVEEVGAQTVEVDYAGAPPPAHDREAWEELRRRVARQIRSYVGDAAPQRVTFVAKSLGTMLLAELPDDVPLPPSVDAIWLTPIFGQPSVRAGAIARGWPSLLVAGEADELHVPAHHQAVADALGATSLVLPRADHLLEVPGDVRATVAGFRTLTDAALDFARVGPC